MASMRSLLAAVAGVVVFVANAGQLASAAESPPALAGTVTSAEEGAMEGVLVSAKKTGSNMTITVVSDAQGRYRFPASKLEPGQYAIRIRAIGYDLDGRVNAEVAAQKTASADLKLRKTQDLAAQMSNSEWLNSMPGTDKQKYILLGCVGCHSLERIVRSKYDADGFLATVQRMSTYANQTTPLNPQKRLTTRDTELGRRRPRARAAHAGRISLQHQSEPVVDLGIPVEDAAAPQGQGDAGDLYRIRSAAADHRTARCRARSRRQRVVFEFRWRRRSARSIRRPASITEFPVPELKKGSPTGTLSLRNDRDGNLWLGMMYQAAIAKFDRKSEKFQTLPIPAELNKANTQVNMTSPWNIGVDGKVWAQNNGFAGMHRIDLEDRQMGNLGAVQGLAAGPQHLRHRRRFEEQRLFHRHRQASTSAASTPKPAKSPCSRRRPRIRARAAA